ncbi:MAG TPA: alpha/beta hydrolase [Pseudonocardiaceae bacterium]|jgi:acetyl esterase/lipase|nr:alpha/beta hydrolase [Pseudonocardiaceae bacterium]
MSRDQLAAIDQEIRNRTASAAVDIDDVRAGFAARISGNDGLPSVRVVPDTLGGVPIAHIGADTGDDVVFHLHGGSYVLGSAAVMSRLSGAVGARAGARVISVDYRLAPEHPFPAALDDAVAAYQGLLDSAVPASRIAFFGESAGGGLVLATLLRARDAGLPLPSSVTVLSPWVDLTMSGASMTERAAKDPNMTKAGFEASAPQYYGASSPTDSLVSPIFADLSGLPPLLIQVGSNEILLDDALGLAVRAAAEEVEVRLEVTPGASHVFQLFGARLDEALAALDSVGAFIRARFA